MTVVLPRTVTLSWSFTRAFYRATWVRIWRPAAARMGDFRKSDMLLSYFGPISLILLLQVWASALILGFALLQWGIGAPLHGADAHPGFSSCLYFSGVTFYTLGYGDLAPRGIAGRFIAVTEAGTGFGFLAVIIGYLPVIYGAFSRREAVVTTLDARAGSPPSALEMLQRHSNAGVLREIDPLLRDLEKWIADLLESHLSYPVLAYYRSQHDDQSWISSLVLTMDTCAVIMTGLEGVPAWQAQLTYAMGRHALVDLCAIFNTPPAEGYLSRLTEPDMEAIDSALKNCCIPFVDADSASKRLNDLRKNYEPYAVSLARIFAFSLPPFIRSVDTADDWERSAWERAEHF